MPINIPTIGGISSVRRSTPPEAEPAIAVHPANEIRHPPPHPAAVLSLDLF